MEKLLQRMWFAHGYHGMNLVTIFLRSKNYKNAQNKLVQTVFYTIEYFYLCNKALIVPI